MKRADRAQTARPGRADDPARSAAGRVVRAGAPGEPRTGQAGPGAASEPTGSGERLQKVLARGGVASRRASEELIRAGRVRVNGAVVTELGVRVDPVRDAVTVDGRPLRLPAAPTYLLLHKPAGYVTTARDELGRPTVLDLVPPAPRVFPVGRLDADTEGLLLLTDDGELALRLTHPRHEVEKTYRALVAGVPDAAALRRLREGVVIEGRRTLPARVELVAAHGDAAELLLTIREGRKRQIRLMAAAVGHPVRRLRRERVGPLELGELPLGRWRRLHPAEVAALRRAVGLPAEPGEEATPPPAPEAPSRPAAAARHCPSDRPTSGAAAGSRRGTGADRALGDRERGGTAVGTGRTRETGVRSRADAAERPAAGSPVQGGGPPGGGRAGGRWAGGLEGRSGDGSRPERGAGRRDGERASARERAGAGERVGGQAVAGGRLRASGRERGGAGEAAGQLGADGGGERVSGRGRGGAVRQPRRRAADGGGERASGRGRGGAGEGGRAAR